MLVEWYWRNQGGIYGPFTEEELIQLAQDGEIGRRCEVRLGEDGRWYPATKVKGLFTPKAPAKQPVNDGSSVVQPADASGSRDDSHSSSIHLKRAKPLQPRVRPVTASESSVIQVAQPPAAAPPTPAPPSTGFAVQTDDGNSAATVPVSQRPRRKSNTLGVMLTVGCLGLAMAGALIFALLWNRGADDLAAVTTEDSSNSPQAASEEETAQDSPTSETAADVPAANLLEQVSTFHDATRSRIKLTPARIKVQEAWVAPTEDGSSTQLFVKLEVTNISEEKTWSYSSFNGTGTEGVEAQACLFDSNDHACQLVPVAERQQQWCPPTVPMAPGQTVEDVLVFEKPPGTIDRMRLVLPRAAIALNGAPMGYQLSQKMIASGQQEAPVTDTAVLPVASSDATDAESDAKQNTAVAANEEAETTPQANAVTSSPAATETEKPAPEEPKNGALPATINGLLDSINNFEKEDQKPSTQKPSTPPQDMPPQSNDDA